MRALATRCAVLIGMAKPMPCPDDRIAVLMPMTSPRAFRSGPPEFPGLMDASVWMKFSLGTMPTSERPVALTTPTVTVCSRPKGLPIAMAHSPTSMRSESPSRAATTPSPAGMRITARSVLESVPTIFPVTSFLLWKRTVISSAPLMTWRFVRM